MRKLALSLLGLIISVFCSCPSFAAKSDLPDYIRDQLHKDIDYTVITERNVDKLDEVLAKAKTKHFIVVQLKSGDMKKEHGDKILAWVQNGGIAWFHDSRLASFLGMENSPLKKDSLKGKEHKGDYGTGSSPGVNVISYVYPFADHPVVSGVQAVQVFLMEVGPDEYSAVNEGTEGVVPLLHVNLDPKAIAAVKKHGTGWVVFKPLLWPDVLGGERFQTNLLEFSGGYPVPQGEKLAIPVEDTTGKPQKLARYDNLLLTDGRQVIGMITDREFEFIGAEDKVTKKTRDLQSIKFQPTGDEIRFTDGKQVTGTLLCSSVSFKTITGKTIRIERENLLSITFNIGENGGNNGGDGKDVKKDGNSKGEVKKDEGKKDESMTDDGRKDESK